MANTLRIRQKVALLELHSRAVGERERAVEASCAGIWDAVNWLDVIPPGDRSIVDWENYDQGIEIKKRLMGGSFFGCNVVNSRK